MTKAKQKGLKLLHSISLKDAEAHKFSWSVDGSYLAFPTSSGKVCLWDVSLEKLTRNILHSSPSLYEIFWKDGSTIIIPTHVDINEFNIHSKNIKKFIFASNGKIYSIKSSEKLGYIAVSFEGRLIHILDRISLTIVKKIYLKKNCYSLHWLSKKKLLVVGLESGDIVFYDLKEFNIITVEKAHFSTVMDIQTDKNESILISCSKDKTIRINSLIDGNNINLEGHVSGIRSICLTSDENILLSSSMDGELRIWRCGDWKILKIYKKFTSDFLLSNVRSCENNNLIAISSKKKNNVGIWEINTDFFIKENPIVETVRYTTAKISLVGDSGVGKTGLGWRLTHNEFIEISSTHGQQFWVFKDLNTVRLDGTECEAVLWDFAGQPDYRVIHTLFLNDSDLSLILFDPANRQEPLKGVEYWLNVLKYSHSGSSKSLLVGARMDRGDSSLTKEELDEFCKVNNITGGFIATSAMTGLGLDILIKELKKLVSWEKMESTVTTKTFKIIKNYVLRKKEVNDLSAVLFSYSEISKIIQLEMSGNKPSIDEISAVIGHLSNHGYISIIRGLNGEEYILLYPDMLINMASSIVLDARRNEKGLGAIDERKAYSMSNMLDEYRNITESEALVIINAAIYLFVRNNVCFRESFGSYELLVFPSLINQRKPIQGGVATKEDVSYLLKGAVENIYSSLVVLLGYSNSFTRTHQWSNKAQYIINDSEICGFAQYSENEGEIELVIYYQEDIKESSKRLFQGLFEVFLEAKDIEITRFLPVECNECDYLQERLEVTNRIKFRYEYMFCTNCGKKLLLTHCSSTITRSIKEGHLLGANEKEAERRTRYEAALVRLKGFIYSIDRDIDHKPTIFISYAWGEKNTENWVEKDLAVDLRNAGINVLLDKWFNAAISSNISRFISEIETSNYILCIGTVRYRDKYNNKDKETGTVVAAEIDLINQRLMGTEEQKKTVLPILRKGLFKNGKVNTKGSFPPLLNGRVYADFTDSEKYYSSLFDLLLTIYQIKFDNQSVIDLRETLSIDLS